MEKAKEFKDLLKHKMNEQIPIQTEWGIIHSVNWEEKTAEVKIDGIIYDDVLLGLGNEYKRPKLSSKCLIGIIENKEGCFLIDADQIEETIKVTGTTKLIQNEDGFIIERNGEKLKDVLNDFIDEVNKILVIKGNTINKVAVNKIKQRLNTILK